MTWNRLGFGRRMYYVEEVIDIYVCMLFYDTPVSHVRFDMKKKPTGIHIVYPAGETKCTILPSLRL